MAVFALGFSICDEKQKSPLEASEGFKVKDGLTAFGLLIGECLALAFVGELASLPIKPTGKPQVVWDGVWIAGRYMALSCAYTFASIISLFNAIMQPYMAETLTWGMLGAFAGAAAYLVAVSTVAGYACGAVKTVFSAALEALKGHMDDWRRRSNIRQGKYKDEFQRGPTKVFEDKGHIYAWVDVSNPPDEKTLWLKLMVDTGATHTRISAKRLKSLGVKPYGECTEKLADGRTVKRRFGYARIECVGNSAVAPVIFGRRRDVGLLGVSAIDQLGILEEVLEMQRRMKALVQTHTSPVQASEPVSTQPEDLVPFSVFEADDCEEARKTILTSGMIAVYCGKNPINRKHMFYLLPASTAERLANREAVSADEYSREAFEQMRLMGYLEGDGEAYRLKSEDLERDLKIQLRKHRNLCIKKLTGYIV